MSEFYGLGDSVFTAIQRFSNDIKNMIYPFLSLKMVGLAMGFVLVASHLAGLILKVPIQTFLKRFPRCPVGGTVLTLLVSAWAFWLVMTMDLGEFSKYRVHMEILIPVACFLSLKYVNDFLSVRALGILLLLLVEPILEVTFLKPGTGRLLMVLLAYAWAVIGMFWVGMPFLLRDQIAWFTQNNLRWQTGCFAGIAYGLALLIFICRY